MDTAASTSPTGLRRALVGRDPRWTLARVAVWAAMLLVLFKFVLLPIRVEGVSMLPTYPERGVNFVNCLAYSFHPPRRGDVIAIRFAGKHLMLMKRIVALPGETIAFHEVRFIIKGFVL